jgi:uncharacterized protein
MADHHIHSCLYKASVMHHRLSPKQHRFNYEIFMFYLDLDEISNLCQRLKCMSRNRFNLFNFRDKDHLQLPGNTKNVREQIEAYLRSQGIQTPVKRIMLLTNLCTLGYQFNPVSFYYCYDQEEQPICAIVEVCNTFHEMKPYLLNNETLTGERFRLNTGKYFYVSPFTDMDTHFEFDLGIPGEKLQIRIDDHNKNGERFLISTLTGTREELNDTNLLHYFFSFPLITLKIIWLIHWQAAKLWLKKLPYHAKAAHKDLQRDLYRPYK